MAEAKPKRATKAKSVPTPVVRDSTFRRAVVDNVFVFDVGGDVELSCMQGGVLINGVNVNHAIGGVEFEADGVLTEVARIRMSWQSAFGMAMNVLGVGIGSRVLDREAILKKIGDFVIEPSDGNHEN